MLAAIAMSLLAVVPDPRFSEVWLRTDGEVYNAVVRAPDGSFRLFLAAKNSGRIRVIEQGVFSLVAVGQLGPIHARDEAGLLGLAPDPAFVSTQQLYAFLTVSETEQQIQRLTLSGNQLIEATPVVQLIPTRGQKRNGGGLYFSPRRELLFGAGDGGFDLTPVRDLTSLFGKLGLTDEFGAAPLDNPFHDALGPNDDRIFALGLRNPVSIEADPASGELWVAITGEDVQQVVIARAGEDYGWPDSEGDRAIVRYDGGAIAGGVFYDGTAFPEEMRGSYFTADRLTGRISEVRTATSAPRPFAEISAGITDLEVGPDGALYAATSTGGLVAFIARQPKQGLILAATHLRGREGTEVATSVRLALPAMPVKVTVQRLSGDPRIELVSPAMIMAPHPHVESIRFRIGEDQDAFEGTAVFQLSGPGLEAQRIEVRAVEVDAQQIVVTPRSLSLEPGEQGFFDVSLERAPRAEVVVTVSAQMSFVEVVSRTMLRFDSANYSQPQRVLLRAAQDVVPGRVYQVDLNADNVGTASVAVSIAAPEPPDAGVAGDAAQNDGAPAPIDAGISEPPVADEGCSCNTTAQNRAWPILVFALFFRRKLNAS